MCDPKMARKCCLASRVGVRVQSVSRQRCFQFTLHAFEHEFAEEGAGGGAVEADFGELTYKAGAGFDQYDAVAAGAPEEHVLALFGGAFEEHFLGGAEELLVPLQLSSA